MSDKPTQTQADRIEALLIDIIRLLRLQLSATIANGDMIADASAQEGTILRRMRALRNQCGQQ